MYALCFYELYECSFNRFYLIIVEQPKAPADSVKVTPETKVGTGPKGTKTVVRKVPVRTKTPTSAKSVSGQTPKAEQSDKLKVEESSGKEEVGDSKDVVSGKKEESSVSNVVVTSPETELTMPNLTETKSASKATTDETMTIVAAFLKPEQSGKTRLFAPKSFYGI